MPFQDEVEKCEASSILGLPFFLVMIKSWRLEPNLDTYSSRMRFFSLVPETDKDVHDVDVGKWPRVSCFSPVAELPRWLMELMEMQMWWR